MTEKYKRKYKDRTNQGKKRSRQKIVMKQTKIRRRIKREM